MKVLITLTSTVAACLLGQPASAGPAASPVEAFSAGALPTSYVQYRRLGRRHHSFRRGYGYRRGYGRGYGYRRGSGIGAAVGSGVAGLAAGAIIGGTIANSQTQAAQGAPGAEAVAACARWFRSYDASSGTYFGNDGARHACP